ncbi:MAG: hypothetical protein ACYCW6_25695, partial [Candidatus Xenobia bacterium]
MSLGTVLAVVCLATLLAFTAAASGSYNLMVTLHVDNTRRASTMAESAVQQAMAHLLGYLNWQGDVQVHDGTTDAIGRLTFNPAAGVPFSTNNSQGNQPT